MKCLPPVDHQLVQGAGKDMHHIARAKLPRLCALDAGAADLARSRRPAVHDRAAHNERGFAALRNKNVGLGLNQTSDLRDQTSDLKPGV